MLNTSLDVITVTKPLIYGPDFDLVQGTILQPLPSDPKQPYLFNFKVLYCPNGQYMDQVTNIHLQEVF